MFESVSRLLRGDPIFDKVRLLLKEGKVVEAMDELDQTSKENHERLALNSPSFDPRLHKELIRITKKLHGIMRELARQEKAEDKKWTRYEKGIRLITEDFYSIPGGPPVWITFVRKHKRVFDLLNAISNRSLSDRSTSDLEQFILALDEEFLDTAMATSFLKNIKMRLLLNEFAEKENLAAMLNANSNAMLLRTRSLASLIADRDIGGSGLSPDSLMPDYEQLIDTLGNHGLIVERTDYLS